jgi:hypothetical protein
MEAQRGLSQWQVVVNGRAVDSDGTWPGDADAEPFSVMKTA